ncbi:MAG: DinB family protein [Acidobacteriota bacterium]
MADSNLRQPHLRRLVKEANAVRSDFEKLFEKWPEEALRWKPAPKVWSAAECVDHLAVTADLYLPRLERVVDRQRPASASFQPSWIGNRFVRALEFGSRPIKTFKVFQPEVSDQSADAVLERYLDRQRRVVELMQTADELDPNRPKLPSPLTRLLRFSLGEAFTILVTHDRRHYRQAMRLSEQPGFPLPRTAY